MLACVALFVASLLPSLGLVPFDYQRYSTVADRYAYLALLHSAWPLACVLANRPRSRGDRGASRGTSRGWAASPRPKSAAVARAPTRSTPTRPGEPPQPRRPLRLRPPDYAQAGDVNKGRRSTIRHWPPTPAARWCSPSSATCTSDSGGWPRRRRSPRAALGDARRRVAARQPRRGLAPGGRVDEGATAAAGDGAGARKRRGPRQPRHRPVSEAGLGRRRHYEAAAQINPESLTARRRRAAPGHGTVGTACGVKATPSTTDKAKARRPHRADPVRRPVGIGPPAAAVAGGAVAVTLRRSRGPSRTSSSTGATLIAIQSNPWFTPPTAASLKHYWAELDAHNRFYVPINYTVWWLLTHTSRRPPTRRATRT